MNLDQALKYININGGATLRLDAEGKLVSLTDDRWYYAAVPDQTSIVDEGRLESALTTFVHDHKIKLLEKNVYLGVWLNPETHQYYIDINYAADDEEVALDRVRAIDGSSRRRVFSIYNPALGKTVSLDGR